MDSQQEKLLLSEAEETIGSLKNESVYYLKHQFNWNQHEALTIYHDASLIVLHQIKKGLIHEVTKPYMLKVCRYLGANAYRKLLKEKARFLTYWKKEQDEHQKWIKTNYGISIFEPDEAPVEEHGLKALRAFSMLTKKCQEIIYLKYVEGLSHKCVSEKSGYVNTIDSAKTVLSRCLKYWKKLNQRL